MGRTVKLSVPLRAHTKGRVAGKTPIVCRHRLYAAGKVRKLVHSNQMYEKIVPPPPSKELFRKSGYVTRGKLSLQHVS